MANYLEARVKVRDTQLNKLKYVAKNKTGKKIRLNKKNFQDDFFLSGFSFEDTGDAQDSRGREATIFYSTLPLSTAHEHSDSYLQLCLRHNCHIFFKMMNCHIFCFLTANSVEKIVDNDEIS